jgi:hypothetical protein
MSDANKFTTSTYSLSYSKYVPRLSSSSVRLCKRNLCVCKYEGESKVVTMSWMCKKEVDALNFETRWKLPINSTLRPLYPQGMSPVSTIQNAGWAPKSVWDAVNNRKILALSGNRCRPATITEDAFILIEKSCPEYWKARQLRVITSSVLITTLPLTCICM